MNRLISAARSARNAAPRNDERGNNAHRAQPTPAKAKQTRTRSDMQKSTAKMKGAVSWTRTHHGRVTATTTNRSDMLNTRATNRHAVFTAYSGLGIESLCI